MYKQENLDTYAISAQNPGSVRAGSRFRSIQLACQRLVSQQQPPKYARMDPAIASHPVKLSSGVRLAHHTKPPAEWVSPSI